MSCLRKMIQFRKHWRINIHEGSQCQKCDSCSVVDLTLTTRNHFALLSISLLLIKREMEEESENTFNDGRLGISRPHHEPLMRSVSEFGFNHRPSRLRLPPGLQHQSRSCTYSLNAARQRTISLNLNCNVVNTEREPILLNENSNKTIFVQGR